MSFFKWVRKKEEEPDENEPVLAADGAGGSVKLLLGAGVVTENIYVAAKNYETARGLYEAYLQTEVEPEEEITK